MVRSVAGADWTTFLRSSTSANERPRPERAWGRRGNLNGARGPVATGSGLGRGERAARGRRCRSWGGLGAAAGAAPLRLPGAPLAMGPGPAPRPGRLPLAVALCAALLTLLPPSLGAGERRRLACSTCRGIVDRFNQVGGGAEGPRGGGRGGRGQQAGAPRRGAGREVPPGSPRLGGSGAGRPAPAALRGSPGPVTHSGCGAGVRVCGPRAARLSAPQLVEPLCRAPGGLPPVAPPLAAPVSCSGGSGCGSLSAPGMAAALGLAGGGAPRA